MKRLLYIAVFSIAGAALLIGGWFYVVLNQALPDDVNEIVTSVTAPATISYDEIARPYVRAATLADALHAQGWLHARERLFQMEMFRRAGSGRLAEALGESMLETDIEMWRAGVPRLAAMLEANASPATRELIAAYVAGVNRALADTAHMPLEIRLAGIDVAPWEASDVFALGALMAFQSARNYRNELLRLALLQHLGVAAGIFIDQRQTADFPYVVGSVVPALERSDRILATAQAMLLAPAAGSNGWVVAPEKTEAGHALFAFDSHDGFSMPNLTYEVHLFFGDDGQIRGTSVPGLPGVINGYNEFMAWGFTNIGDSQDLFIETRESGYPLRFKRDDGWYTAEVEHVRIPVSGDDDYELDVVVTANGRLINDNPAIALRWSALEVGELGLDGLFALNRATSYADFTEAMDNFAAPSANATYADKEGRIAVRTTGKLPIRGAGQGLLPLPGSSSRNAWQGLIDADEMPRDSNPERGYLVAANARVHDKPPLISADNSPGYRARRLHTLLAAGKRFVAEDMQTMQVDWRNGQAEQLLPNLLTWVDTANLDARGQRAHEILSTWAVAPDDLPDSPAPLLYAAWYQALVDTLFADRLPADLYERLLRSSYVLNHAIDQLVLIDTQSSWWGDGREVMITSALNKAIEDLSGDLDALRWDAVHAVHLKHELSGIPLLGRHLSSGPYPWGGGNATVGRARYNHARPYTATGGATTRLVLEMSDPIRAWSIMPGGQSGHLLSPHYDDQTMSWLSGGLVPIAAYPEDLGAAQTTLRPRAN